LALALAIALRDTKEPMPAAVVGLSPWTDLVLPCTTLQHLAHEEAQLLEALEIRSWGPLYAGQSALTHPLISPVHAKLHNLPPLLIQLSDAEVLCDDGLTFVQKAQAAGVSTTLQVFPGLVHWWHLFWRFVPEAGEALNQVAGFLCEIWANQAQVKNAATAARRRTALAA
jgi:acetyl esterase/lipase